MRLSSIPAAVALAATLALVGAPAAFAAPAAEPVDLEGAYWVDRASALDVDGSNAVQAALDELSADTDVDLFVVFVESFDDTDPQQWANTSAELSGLGDSDILLAIATGDRVYRWSVTDAFPLDSGRLEQVAADDLEPALRVDDWAGGAVGFADGLSGAINPTFPWVPVLVVLGVIAGIILLVVIIARARRAAATRRTAEQERMTQAQLDQRAGSLLVALDDALKTSEQELGFAVAEFGDGATAQFGAALASATTKATEAFGLRTQVDSIPVDQVEQRRTLTLRIIELCEAADQELDAQSDAFEELRQLEQHAPQLLETVSAERDAQVTRIAAADATVTALASRFGAANTAAIAGNVEQARKLDGFAAESIGAARTSLTAGRTGEAALQVRAAQQSVGQVDDLVDAIDAAAVDVPKLAERLDALLADTRADVAEARGLPSKPGVDQAALTGIADEADRAVAAAEGADLRTAIDAVTAANSRLNEELGAVRGRQQQLDRAVAQLPGLLDEARSSVLAAQRYITSRRGGVDETPRTRLAEAEGLITSATAAATTDPLRAHADATQADSLADGALRLAQRQTDSWRDGSGGGSGGGSSDGDDWGGAILGGILGGLLSGGGGGRSSGGWSGGSSSGWGGGSSSGGFGGFRSGGGGGRSSGGGRSGGGGRF